MVLLFAKNDRRQCVCRCRSTSKMLGDCQKKRKRFLTDIARQEQFQRLKRWTIRLLARQWSLLRTVAVQFCTANDCNIVTLITVYNNTVTVTCCESLKSLSFLKEHVIKRSYLAPCHRSRNPESTKFLLLESGILNPH